MDASLVASELLSLRRGGFIAPLISGLCTQPALLCDGDREAGAHLTDGLDQSRPEFRPALPARSDRYAIVSHAHSFRQFVPFDSWMPTPRRCLPALACALRITSFGSYSRPCAYRPHDAGQRDDRGNHDVERSTSSASWRSTAMGQPCARGCDAVDQRTFRYASPHFDGLCAPARRCRRGWAQPRAAGERRALRHPDASPHETICPGILGSQAEQIQAPGSLVLTISLTSASSTSTCAHRAGTACQLQLRKRCIRSGNHCSI